MRVHVPGPRWLVPILGLALALGVAACTDPEVSQRQPASTVDGIQLTGQLDGHRLAVSDGEPEVVLGDCDAADGVDEDLCVVARTIDGATLAIVIENPFALSLADDVAVTSCSGRCDDAAGVVAEVRLDGAAKRATGGAFSIKELGPRWVMSFTIRFGGGDALSGEFDVRPQPGS